MPSATDWRRPGCRSPRRSRTRSCALPGERHRTLVWLLVGDRDLIIESFVCRQPDENHQEVYRYLLQRNASLRSVAYCLDRVGDIHLVGRIGLDAISAAEIDTLLGVVLAASDADFNPILQRGFPSSIRREWAWRQETGSRCRTSRRSGT